MKNAQPQNPLPSLMSRFPYQFSGENIGISVAKGWSGIFTKLCEDIDSALGEDKRGFHWRQVKEKFGTVRFYWKLGSSASTTQSDVAELMAALQAMVNEAEVKTSSACIICGITPASIDSTNGWLLTLCDEHSKQRRADDRSLPSPYFQ